MVFNTCKLCECRFEAKRRSKKFCSPKCCNRWLSKERTGEGNPRYSEGGTGWRQYINVLKDVNACQNCGREYNLETHHLNGNHKDNRKENLIKICRRCHMMLDGRLKTFNKNTWHKGKHNVYSKDALEKMSEARIKYWQTRKECEENGSR